MSTAKTRRMQITEIVNNEKIVSVNDLATKFKVSLVTIRTDLDVLENEGYLFRSHGFANALDRRDENILHTIELSLPEKSNRNRHLKVKLAVQAVKYIDDYDTIMLDSGSTTLEIARQIARRKWDRLTVITNSVPICSELAGVRGVDIISTGGRLRKKSRSFAGIQAEKALRDIRFSKLFLSTDGYDLRHGITTHSEVEASLNRLMCEIASEIYIVTDYTKFGRQSSNWIRDFADIDYVITDSGITNEYLTTLRAQNVKVVLVD